MPKSKIYRCRHCSHETNTKTNNWLHIKTHLKPERLLTCNVCQFVTEYKHHLEYHERNHAGVKPFKCDQCEYRCVNMSMLKSHLRSHSSECPFQCKVCKYSTKHPHSLKTHQKKYDHEPTEPSGDIRSCNNNDTNHHLIESISPAPSTLTSSTSSVSSTESPSNSSKTRGLNSNNNDDHIVANVMNQQQQQHCILDLRIESKLQAIRT